MIRHSYSKANSYDELRAKIEHKIKNTNSPFRKVKKLADLFSREKTGQINNLETLLKICAASNEIKIEYDLKFKLRYLISNVLLYNSNNYKKMKGIHNTFHFFLKYFLFTTLYYMQWT